MQHTNEKHLKNVTTRSAAMGAQTVQQHAEAENALAGTLKSLFAIAEAYPELKANQNFLELQRELSDTENKIQAARRFYNTNVRDLNTAVDSFPSNVVARMFGFAKRAFFDIEEQERAPSRGSILVSYTLLYAFRLFHILIGM